MKNYEKKDLIDREKSHNAIVRAEVGLWSVCDLANIEIGEVDGLEEAIENMRQVWHKGLEENEQVASKVFKTENH